VGGESITSYRGGANEWPAIAVIGPDGAIRGYFRGDDRAKGRWCFGVVNRKVIRVWSTGCATGHVEELVYAGKLDEGQFGLNRPDYIGWQGGVPLVAANGQLIAAAFAVIRGAKESAISEHLAAAVPGLHVKPP